MSFKSELASIIDSLSRITGAHTRTLDSHGEAIAQLTATVTRQQDVIESLTRRVAVLENPQASAPRGRDRMASLAEEASAEWADNLRYGTPRPAPAVRMKTHAEDVQEAVERFGSVDNIPAWY